MKIFSFINAKFPAMVVAFAMLLCGCGGSNNDEPDVPVTPDEIEYEPLSGLNPDVPLLNGYEKIVGYQLWGSEKIPDGDLTGEGFSYDYWKEHKGEAKSLEELMALCEVPQEQLAAMSTRNLVLTCYVHPYNSIYNAYDNQYLGVMAAMSANCWQELMKRKTGASQLLDLYCELTYPTSKSSIDIEKEVLSYLDYKELTSSNPMSLNPLTLAMMTAVDRNAYTPEQLTRIASEIFKKIDNIVNAEDGIYSYVGAIRYHYLLGAFISYRYDRTLSPLELSLLYDLTGWIGVPGYDPNTGRHFTVKHVVMALEVVTKSLERIEQGSLLATTP